MKMAVLAALYRGGVNLDTARPLVNRFTSAVGGSFASTRAGDSDPEPWRLLDTHEPASLRWLAERMITHSSNLATNICLAAAGPDAVAQVWQQAGATHSTSPRGIEDHAARLAGVDNRVTAGDLVRLLESLEPGLLALLERNIWRVDLAAGLPAGTRIAFKNGWVDGVRHSAGIVHPDDTPPYVIAVCYSGPLGSGRGDGDPAARMVARLSAGVWARRRELFR
jgi:beta-lactamase class A